MTPLLEPHELFHDGVLVETVIFLINADYFFEVRSNLPYSRHKCLELVIPIINVDCSSKRRSDFSYNFHKCTKYAPSLINMNYSLEASDIPYSHRKRAELAISIINVDQNHSPNSGGHESCPPELDPNLTTLLQNIFHHFI